MVTQPRAQRLVAQFPQLDLYAPSAILAFLVVKNHHYLHFSGRFRALHHPHCRALPPSVVSAGHHAQYLVQLLDEMVNPLLINEGQQAHGVGGAGRWR